MDYARRLLKGKKYSQDELIPFLVLVIQSFGGIARKSDQQLLGDIWMPEISRFLGIIIAMFYKDLAPPHFHAIYGEYEITVEIESGVINGRFPRRALRLVLEWLELHKDELLENWQLIEEKKPLKKIAPLE
jgi:hypothetical protein